MEWTETERKALSRAKTTVKVDQAKYLARKSRLQISMVECNGCHTIMRSSDGYLVDEARQVLCEECWLKAVAKESEIVRCRLR